MAKISGINTNLRGQIGGYLFRKTKYGTVVSEAPTKRTTPVRTENQMYIRTQWVNLGAVYRQFNKTLKKAYEGLGNTMSVYNAFVQANINVVKVFITKRVKANGGSVLAPYQITRGTLPSIRYVKGEGERLVTNLSLGSLVIGPETVVGELAEAVIGHNAEWEEGDQLTFFYGRQTVDEVTETPRAVISGTKVLLEVTDDTVLWEVTGSLGFCSVSDGQGGYVLGMSHAVTDGAAAWIHSREAENSDEVRVGTQCLFVDSSVLAQWQGEDAFDASAESYGGINATSVYLDPKALRGRAARTGRATVTPVNWESVGGASAGSGGSETGGGSGTGGSDNGSGGGNTGGGGSNTDNTDPTDEPGGGTGGNSGGGGSSTGGSETGGEEG